MRLFFHQLRWDQLVFWRSREAAVFVFLFPLLLFALLTAVYNGHIYGRPASWALLAGMLAGRRVACGCFGDDDLPVSRAHVIASELLGALTAAAILAPPRGLEWLLMPQQARHRGHVILANGTAR